MGPYKPLRTWVDEFIPYYMEISWELIDPIAHMNPNNAHLVSEKKLKDFFPLFVRYLHKSSNLPKSSGIFLGDPWKQQKFRKTKSKVPNSRLSTLSIGALRKDGASRNFVVQAIARQIKTSEKWAWNPKQPFINRCLVKQPFPYHFLCKDWVHHPIETTIYKWLALGFQGGVENRTPRLITRAA